MFVPLNNLRQCLRQRRKQLGVGRQRNAAHQLLQRIKDMDVYKRSQRVACYIASDGELDCRPVIQQIWRDGKCCLLPVINTQTQPAAMEFRAYSPGQMLAVNRFGIPEPLKGKSYLPQQLDLVLVPLVGFDNDHNRLGMGGGFYDRCFAEVRRDVGPVLFGVAHRCQRVSHLQAQPWDIKMDRIIAV